MSLPPLQQFTTLIKRLEAATSRLEDLADASGAPPAKYVPTPPIVHEPVPVPEPEPEPMPVEPKVEEPALVVAYDEMILNGKLVAFLEKSDEVGGFVVEHAETFRQLFVQLRAMILMATACKKPATSAAFEKALVPLKTALIQVQKKKDAYRGTELVNFANGMKEGASACGWVAIEPKPAPFITEIRESTQFYTNRILKEFKEKKPLYIEWVKSFSGLLDELKKYVEEHHTTGLSWNPKGIDMAEYKAGPTPPYASMEGRAPPPAAPASAPASTTSSVSAPPPPAPPPPPPPPPAMDVSSPPAVSKAAAADPSAVFAQLNIGEGVTKGLRKVADEEKTHKNPELRAGGSVPGVAQSPSPPTAAKPTKPSKPKALAGKKPAKLELEGKKWAVEYQENESQLKIENAEISHVVNVFGCKNTTLQVVGKVNAVAILNCQKTSLLIDSVISAISITGSTSIQVQILGSVPTILLDGVDSAQIFLSKDSMNVEIVSSKCSAINVSIPEEGAEEGVFEERAMPEQLRTVLVGGKLVTSVVEHAG